MSISFFLTEDLERLSHLAGRRYDKNYKTHATAADLYLDVYKKTIYWAETVANKTSLLHSTDMRWLHPARGEMRFSPYTWARIFYEQTADIYFTVGYDFRNNELIYKIDYQKNERSGLDWKQKELCKALIEGRGIVPQTIPINGISDYDWEKLIDETIVFVKRHKLFLEEMIQTVVASYIPSKLARICWNSMGWLEPSGEEGKSKDPNSFEMINGYGHEEWLFDLEKAIDGYHYSALQPVGKHRASYAGKKLNIRLFTRDETEKKWFWVGEISDAEVLTDDQIDLATEVYEKKGWLIAMCEQIKSRKGNDSVFGQNKDYMFNIRFRLEDIRRTELIPMTPNEIPRQKRYELLDNKQEPPKTLQDFPKFNKGSFERSPDKVKKHFTTHVIEYPNVHSEIQAGLINELASQYGSENVTFEEKVIGRARPDIIRRDGNDIILYEVKSYLDPRTSVRVALGQLMDYCLFPDRQYGNKLYIVSQIRADDELAKYIKHLNSFIKIPIGYKTYSLLEQKIIQTIEP